MLLINHMVLQLWAGKEQKAWQPFGDWHLVPESPSFFCYSLSAHFQPSIPSLFKWLFVKVLLSASTCPCHSKQRQPGDTALSLLSPVSALSSPLPSSLTSFYFVSPLDFLPSPTSFSSISPFLFMTRSLSFSLRPFFFVFLSFSLMPFVTTVWISWSCDKLMSSLSLLYIYLSPFFFLYLQSLGPLNISVALFYTLLNCEIYQKYDLHEDKICLNAHKSRWHCKHSISFMPFPTVKSRFLYSGLVYHVQSLGRLRMSALCKSLPARTNKPGPINVNPHSFSQSMSFPFLQNQV